MYKKLTKLPKNHKKKNKKNCSFNIKSTKNCKYSHNNSYTFKVFVRIESCTRKALRLDHLHKKNALRNMHRNPGSIIIKTNTIIVQYRNTD